MRFVCKCHDVVLNTVFAFIFVWGYLKWLIWCQCCFETRIGGRNSHTYESGTRHLIRAVRWEHSWFQFEAHAAIWDCFGSERMWVLLVCLMREQAYEFRNSAMVGCIRRDSSDGGPSHLAISRTSTTDLFSQVLVVDGFEYCVFLLKHCLFLQNS